MHEILYRLRNSGPGLHASNPLANVNNLGRKVAIHCVFQWFVAPEGQKVGSLKLAWDHVQWLWAWLLQSPYECVSNAFEPQGPSLAVIWLQGSVLLGRCNTATSRTNLQCTCQVRSNITSCSPSDRANSTIVVLSGKVANAFRMPSNHNWTVLAVIWLQGSVLLGRCNTATSRTNLQCIPARNVAGPSDRSNCTMQL